MLNRMEQMMMREFEKDFFQDGPMGRGEASEWRDPFFTRHEYREQPIFERRPPAFEEEKAFQGERGQRFRGKIYDV